MNNLNLCPMPKSFTFTKGKFSLNSKGYISVENIALFEGVLKAKELFLGNIKVIIGNYKTNTPLITVKSNADLGEEEYRLSVLEHEVVVAAKTSAGTFYALMTLMQLCNSYGNELPCMEIEDTPYFKIRGYMLDIARDKVPTLETLKEKVRLLASLKINHFQLYFEGAPFEYKDYEDMWFGKEILTAEEFYSLDQYCKSFFIELVPCQNTFGHMGKWLSDGGYRQFAECPNGFNAKEDGRFVPWPLCIDPSNKEAFEFIENISNDLLQYSSSNKYNVCCDETLELGLGKSKSECEKIGVGRVYLNYLLKLYNYCKSKGKTMMFWADIINEYPELVPEIPQDVIALNWGYYNDLPKEESCIAFEKSNIPYCVCPGTAAWSTFIGNIPQMLENTKTTILKGYRHNAIGVVNTEWGDNGHKQGNTSAYAGLVYGAAMSWQPEINAEINIEQVLNVHIFKDISNLMGKIVLTAGSFVNYEPKLVENTSFSQMLINNGIENYKIVEEYAVADFEKVEAYLTPLLHNLECTNMQCDCAENIKREWALGIKTVLTAQKIGKYLLYKKDGNKQMQKETAVQIKMDMNFIVKEYTKLWLDKNKLSDLNASLEIYKVILNGISKEVAE